MTQRSPQHTVQAPVDPPVLAGPAPRRAPAGSYGVQRALAMLEYLVRHPGERGVRELALALDMSPSSAYRLLETMRQAGFVRQNAATDKYAIGVKAVQLGLAALGTLDITAVAPAHLRALVDETGESAFLAVRDGTEIVYLLKEEGRRSIRTTAVLGSRRGLHCTALGKALLSTLPTPEAEALLRRAGLPAMTPHTVTDLAALWEELSYVRVRGYATDHEEIEEGLACVAAPVRDHQGDAIAAVSISGPAPRILPQEERLGRRIVATALEISTMLGYAPQVKLATAPVPAPAPPAGP